jgi:hypothetical protein
MKITKLIKTQELKEKGKKKVRVIVRVNVIKLHYMHELSQ